MTNPPTPEDVFVAGGLPAVTYVPRDAKRLEERLKGYLRARHKLLSVSGPTKCGKTVLLRAVLDEHVWIPGADIHSLTEFWDLCCAKMNLSRESTQERSQESGRESRLGSEAGVEWVGVAKATTEAAQSTTRSIGNTEHRQRPASLAAQEALEKERRVLVVDDFHYIPADVQLQIVRGLKDAIFKGVAVIFAAVKHRAYDAVRVEGEMTGRVEQLPINFWDRDELLAIAAKGFEELKLLDPSNLAHRLADECFKSPFLMQDFCLALCRSNGIEQRGALRALHAPTDWDVFFRERATGAAKTAFDRLARGPKRTDRMERKLRRGGTTDIYGAVLMGIAKTGPLTELKYEALAAALREVLEDNVPQQHEVTRVLEEMTRIAREDKGEPVVDFDADLRTLHISDPYFAYYLRWGMQQ